MIITTDQWRHVRDAVARTGARFADLVDAHDPQTMVTADWTIAQTCAHLVSITHWYATVFSSGDVPPEYKNFLDQMLVTNVDTVADLNDVVMTHVSERDATVLTRRLRTDIETILRLGDSLDPAQPIQWLGDARVPIAGTLAHLVNELQIHGNDIALATRSPWVIPPDDAGLFFDLFLVGLLRNSSGHLLDSPDPPRERRIAVEFRSRHTTPTTLVLQRGMVTVEEPRPGNDVRLIFDPPSLNLMMFGRISRARAVLTGKVAIRGPRPWLLPTFLRTVRLPS